MHSTNDDDDDDDDDDGGDGDGDGDDDDMDMMTTMIEGVFAVFRSNYGSRILNWRWFEVGTTHRRLTVS